MPYVQGVSFKVEAVDNCNYGMVITYIYTPLK